MASDLCVTDLNGLDGTMSEIWSCIMKVGDKVRMPRAWVRDWEYPDTMGVVHKINGDGWVIVHWDDLYGDYYYSPEQTEKLEVISESR